MSSTFCGDFYCQAKLHTVYASTGFCYEHQTQALDDNGLHPTVNAVVFTLANEERGVCSRDTGSSKEEFNELAAAFNDLNDAEFANLLKVCKGWRQRLSYIIVFRMLAPETFDVMIKSDFGWGEWLPLIVQVAKTRSISSSSSEV